MDQYQRYVNGVLEREVDEVGEARRPRAACLEGKGGEIVSNTRNDEKQKE
jgi:hypothetical protein